MLAFFAALDAGAWLWATAALRAGIAGWAERQRDRGVEAVVTDERAGGWPFAATLRYSVRLGPGGLPEAARLEAALISSVSLTRPTVVSTDIAGAALIAANGSVLSASAKTWVADVALADPDRVVVEAAGLRVAWGARHLDIASLSGEIGLPSAVQSVALSVRDIDFSAAARPLPAPFGALIGSVRLDALLHGGLPPMAATAEASASAWRSAGGEIEVKRLAVDYGPLDASATGRVGLDATLRPAGAATIGARGLVALLDALGGSGIIPARAGQAAGGVLALLGGGETTQVPVTVAEGRVAVAGFPIARLPRLAWEPQ